MKKIFITIILIFLNISYVFSQANEQKFQLAESYEKGGDFDPAARLYEELYKNSPQQKYFEGIARIYKLQNRFAELKPFVDEQLKTNKSMDLLILSGEINWQLGRTDAANAAWKEVLATYSDRAETYIKLTETLNSLILFNKSIIVLQEAKSKYPDNLTFSDGLSRLYIITKNYTDGMSEVLYILERNKNIQNAQGKIYTMMNDPQANKYIDATFQKELERSTNIYILSLYSWYLRTNKNFAKALNVVIELDKVANSKGYEIYKFGEESRRDGDYDVALQSFQIIISMDKKSTPYINSALFLYNKTMEEKLQIESKLSANDANEIIKNYREIITNYPKSQYSEQSKLRIADIENNILNDTKAAIKELNAVVTTKFNSLYVVQALYSLSEIYLQINEIDKCQNTINEMLNTYGKQITSPDIVVLLNKARFMKAELFYYKGDINSALLEYQALSKLTDADIANDALDRIVLIDQNKDLVKALSIFSHAELAFKQNKFREAITYYKNVIQLADGEQLGEKSVIKCSEIEISMNSFEDAKTDLKQYLDKNMYPLYGDNALFLLGNIAEKQSSKDEAMNYYTNLLTKYPRSIFLIDTRKRIKELRNNT